MTGALAGVLPDVILAGAARRPQAVAVRQWEDRLSYAELAAGAARLAELLWRQGVAPERRVGICVHRRPPLVTAVLGVLLSGGAYVPLDPDGPPARLASMLDDAGVEVVVADPGSAAMLERLGRTFVTVPTGASGPPVPAPPCPARPDNAAYVLYTSGSTGRPKGVVVSHRSLRAYAHEFGALTGADQGTRSFGFASLGFDVSVLDVLVPLAAGGAVQLLGEADRNDPARLQRFAEEHAVTWGCIPVALLPVLDPERLPAWRTVITGAEAPGPEQVVRWAGPAEAPRRRFLNCYGPTEATVCVTAFETAGRWERPLPLGGPFAGHRVHVVDERLEPVPAGVPGELLIGGVGLARGYLGRPGLTAERFLPDPFGPEPGARLYRTGDRVVREPDGNLLFLGRTDRQVKIRGQRVETGEVEAIVRAHPRVAHAVVEAVPGPDGLELVAFCTPRDAPDDADLREHCARRLPAAMVPARIVRLERIPLTSSGKVDGQALRARLAEAGRAAAGPGQGRAAGSGPGDAGAGRGRRPAGRVEEAVAAAWSRLLDVPPEGLEPDDDFFAAGGHSVTAMRLVAALRAELGRDLAVEDVFAGRTLRRIAARAAAAPPHEGGELPAGSPPRLSPAQRRLWFIDKLDPSAAPYNVALAERLRGPLDVPALRAALAAVAARHEVLRWRVVEHGGAPRVEVDPPAAAELPVTDLARMEPAARRRALRERLEAAARRRLDLDAGPRWRAALYRLAPDDHVLAITLHHAVFDGWSQGPWFADLGRAYGAARLGASPELAPPPARYADYVAWRERRDRARGEADLAWWTRHLEGAPTVLELPRDGPRPPVQTYAGNQLHGQLSAATTTAVRELAARLGATAPSVLLAGFAELLRRLTGRHDLVVGTPAADRRHAAFHHLVGFFIEVVPLRLRLAPGSSFAERVRACADELLDALAHPAAPLERIVDALGVRRDPARPPLVQVLFNVHNFPEPRLRLDGLRTERLTPGLPGSPFDLTVYVVERDGAFAVDLVHNPEVYRPEAMRSLLEAYQRLLERLCAAPDVPAAGAPPPGPALDVPAAGAPGPAAASRGAAAGPATATERAVADAWCQVLGLDRVGVTDNFFDVGGNSMAVVVLRARLAELLGREVGVVDLFRFPTVRALAAWLDGDGAADGAGLRRAAQRAAARRQRGGSRR